MLLRAALRAVVEPEDVGAALQRALEEQKRLDMFDLQCQSCGGLGVVINLTDRALDEDGHTLYGSQRCLACDGLGSPRA